LVIVASTWSSTASLAERTLGETAKPVGERPVKRSNRREL
jgi:hypothetical protein